MILPLSMILNLTLVSRSQCELVLDTIWYVNLWNSGNNMQFVQSVKYFGINLVSNKNIKFSVDHVKIKFFVLSRQLYTLGAKEQTQNLWLLNSWSPFTWFIVCHGSNITDCFTSVHIFRALYKNFSACDSDSFKQMRQWLGLNYRVCLY